MYHAGVQLTLKSGGRRSGFGKLYESVVCACSGGFHISKNPFVRQQVLLSVALCLVFH